MKAMLLSAVAAMAAAGLVLAPAEIAAAKPAAHAKPHAKPSAKKAPGKKGGKAAARKTSLKGDKGKGKGKKGKGRGRADTRRIAAAAADPVKPVLYVSDGPTAYRSCSNASKAFLEAAAKNASTIDTLSWSPFGAGENGWQIYETMMGQEIGTDCGGGTPVFAEKLAAWQAKFNLPADGVFGPETFQVFKGVWQERRPFVMLRVAGVCPDAPPAEALTLVPADQETFDRDDRALRSDAYLAYQAMLEAARRESPAIHNDLKAMTLFSGYRSPESDAVRCENEHNCDGLRRAACSAHRTGTALDLNVGWVDKDDADSTALENRKWQVRSPAYKWLVKNAGRFGFVNYAFEPWHWEYVGGSQPLYVAKTAPVEAAAPPASAEAPAAQQPPSSQ